jgi:hypothetical protein
MEFKVEEKKTFEYYNLTIHHKLPKELIFYNSLEKLYRYLAGNSKEILSFSIEGKYLIIKDYIGMMRPKYTKLALKQMTLSFDEIREIKMKKLEKRNAELEDDLKRKNEKIDLLNKEVDLLTKKIREL